MKTNYFTKVENKYVFNVSLIFWHLFIALSTIAVVLSIVVFLWSIIPPIERKVVKQPYPEKKQYPEPVKVLLSELKFEDAKQVEVLPPPPKQVKQDVAKEEPKVYEDTRGKTEYDASLNTLKNLIPPAKYKNYWTGSGSWSYPYGERYWTVYNQEKYRQWNISKAGIEDKLKSTYRKSNAGNFPEKKQLLDAYITVLKLLPEEKRIEALEFLINYTSSDINQNVNVNQAISRVVVKLKGEKNIEYINYLAVFCNNNPTDGAQFVEYISSIIDKFDIQQRSKIIEDLTSSYYNFFSQNFAKQKEATNLIIPMLNQLKGEDHSKTLLKYYRIYLQKNYERDNSIAQIDIEHQEEIKKIDIQYENEKSISNQKHYENENTKTEYRYKSLIVIGGGIILFVLIASILVFLSIQRSVRRIEEKILEKVTT